MWWNFGKYGPQNVHMHPCECGVELQGVGASCTGKGLHRRVRYDEKKEEWVSASS
jgi:hypothetical protein